VYEPLVLIDLVKGHVVGIGLLLRVRLTETVGEPLGLIDFVNGRVVAIAVGVIDEVIDIVNG
jgi:hypothetical protein